MQKVEATVCRTCRVLYGTRIEQIFRLSSLTGRMAFLFIQEIFLAATASFHRVFFAVRQQSEGQRAVYATHLGRLDDVVPGVDGEVPELAVLLVEVPDVHGVVVGDELVAGRPLHHVDLRLEVVRLVGLAHLDDAEHHDEDGRPDVQVLPRHIESHAEDDRRRKCPGDECLKALRRLSFLVPLGDILPEALLVLTFEIGVVSVILPVLEVLRADAVGAVHVDGVLLQVRLDLRQWPRPGPHHHRAAARPPPDTRTPAAGVQQLWPRRRLHPRQLLRRCVMAAPSGAGRCRWRGRDAGGQAAAHYLAAVLRSLLSGECPNCKHKAY